MEDEPPPPNRTLAFNLYKIKGKARRLGRRGSVGSARWSPFRLVDHEQPVRRNTASDAEMGNADSGDAGTRLQQSTTAPEAYNSHKSEAAVPSPVREGDEDAPQTQSSTYESQATTVGNADAQANGNLRNRNKPGTSDTESPDVPAPGDDEKPKKTKSSLFNGKKPKHPFTFRNQFQRTILNSYINILLAAVPAGIALGAKQFDGKLVFGINFIAIVPLAAMLSFATEEIALRTGETIGGLINATFGNAVELIVAIIALVHREPELVKTSLIGSMLSNLLLVLGMCFLFGGINRRVQYFNKTVAQTAASLLALATASVIVPTMFEDSDSFEDAGRVAAVSHGVSVILLIVYAAYLFFQLKTHSKVFNEPSQKAEKISWRKNSAEGHAVGTLVKAGADVGNNASAHTGFKNQEGEPMNFRDLNAQEEEEEEEEEEPQLHFFVAVGTLAISTVFIGVCAEYMVEGIQAVTEEGVTIEFVGLILLPIVGNAAEHATAVTVACKDKMDLAIGVAVGSSMQVSLFLLPLLVIIGWGMGIEAMNLAFDNFQIAVLFVSVLLVNYLIGDGESHWLEGLQLVTLYAIIAICAWFYPNSPQNAGSV